MEFYSLGDQEDASKQGRKIADIDADAELEVKVEKVVSTAKVTTASATTTSVDELTLAQTLIEIKVAKPKAFTTAATTTTTAAKDKGKAKMVEPEKPLKKKDQIMYDQENNVQAMIEVYRLLAKRLQEREQEELTNEEKERLFVELLEKRKKHFATLRAQDKRNKPPTKAQKKSTMSTYLKHMDGYKQSQLKNKSFGEIQKLFDKAMTRKVAKKQKIYDDQEEAEMKKHMEIVLDEEEIVVDAIPLATKPPIICIDREDLETLWKLVKVKHGLTRLEEGYERVLWLILLVYKLMLLVPVNVADRDTTVDRVRLLKKIKTAEKG
ncbi:hypothetical protein Tco_0410878 [Tanacetum coccineum]